MAESRRSDEADMTVVFKHIEIDAPEDQVGLLRDCLPDNEGLLACFDEEVTKVGASARSKAFKVSVDGYFFFLRKVYPGKVTLYVKRSPLVTLRYVLRYEKGYYTPNPVLVFRPVVIATFGELQGQIDANILMSQSWEEGISFPR